MRRGPDAIAEDLRVLMRHRVAMVIVSVGSPATVGPLHDAGCRVFADMASLRHAEKALAAGVDGLVLLSAGAGGQICRVNGMSFVRAERGFHDGPLVPVGGIHDGAALWAARALGRDLGMMVTRFIATPDSLAAGGRTRRAHRCRVRRVAARDGGPASQAATATSVMRARALHTTVCNGTYAK